MALIEKISEEYVCSNKAYHYYKVYFLGILIKEELTTTTHKDLVEALSVNQTKLPTIKGFKNETKNKNKKSK